MNRLSAISGHRRSFAGTRRERSRNIKKPLLKLVKQDLKNFLRLIGDCRPTLDQDSLRLDIQKLERCEAADYLFLVRREKSYLFPIAEIYVPEQYAYLCWTAYTLFPDMLVDAFYFHVEDTEIGLRGSVVLLDYGESAADVVRAAEYPLGKRVSHIVGQMKHWREHAKLCTVAEMVAAMGGEPKWM